MSNFEMSRSRIIVVGDYMHANRRVCQLGQIGFDSSRDPTPEGVLVLGPERRHIPSVAHTEMMASATDSADDTRVLAKVS